MLQHAGQGYGAAPNTHGQSPNSAGYPSPIDKTIDLTDGEMYLEPSNSYIRMNPSTRHHQEHDSGKGMGHCSRHYVVACHHARGS